MFDFMHRYPYQNFHEINLDWIIETVTKIKQKFDDNIEGTIVEEVDKRFNDIMIGASYEEENERLYLTRQNPTPITVGSHRYIATTHTMEIEED